MSIAARLLPLALLALASRHARAQSPEPFAWGDFTWMNGASRQTEQLLDTKYFTPQLDIDSNYTYSFNRPIDDTIVGSTATARHNELDAGVSRRSAATRTSATCAGRSSCNTARAPPSCRATTSPSTAGSSICRPRIATSAKPTPATTSNKLRGINVDVGIFMSYVGLFSYTQFENWGYQPSFTSDNTPWFFNGVAHAAVPDRPPQGRAVADQRLADLRQVQRDARRRLSDPLTRRANGSTSCSTATSAPIRRTIRAGCASTATTACSSATTTSRSQAGSAAARSRSRSISASSRATACSVSRQRQRGALHNATPCEQDFVSGMAYNRLWFCEEPARLDRRRRLHPQPRPLPRAGADRRGGVDRSIPTRAPSSTAGTSRPTSSYYPTENITFRLESSCTTTRACPTTPAAAASPAPTATSAAASTTPTARSPPACRPGWTPDLVKKEIKLIFAVLFRL